MNERLILEPLAFAALWKGWQNFFNLLIFRILLTNILLIGLCWTNRSFSEHLLETNTSSLYTLEIAYGRTWVTTLESSLTTSRLNVQIRGWAWVSTKRTQCFNQWSSTSWTHKIEYNVFLFFSSWTRLDIVKDQIWSYHKIGSEFEDYFWIRT